MLFDRLLEYEYSSCSTHSWHEPKLAFMNVRARSHPPIQYSIPYIEAVRQELNSFVVFTLMNIALLSMLSLQADGLRSVSLMLLNSITVSQFQTEPGIFTSQLRSRRCPMPCHSSCPQTPSVSASLVGVVSPWFGLTVVRTG